MHTKLRNFAGACVALVTVLAAATGWAQEPATPASAAASPDFASPEAAANALADAVRAEDPQAILALMGPEADEWLFSGDDVADRADWMRFLEAWDRRHAVAKSDAAQATLLVGDDDWAFPAPIVKIGERWAFDGEAGREEVTLRRVGRNELDAIQTLLAIVDAQREYAAEDADGDGFNAYASRFISSPGKKDGLYWAVQPGEEQSPLGPLVGEAADEGYGKETNPGEPRPYHGYHYRLLTGQGPDAPGGAYDYLVNGRLLGGFAVVAYPARYGVSGIMTLMVNHGGVVYQKDLGDDTAVAATAITSFNPDASWARAE
ncbi:MAG: hypothetical protein RLZ44_1685 [Pseudomonadota bacterium]